MRYLQEKETEILMALMDREAKGDIRHLLLKATDEAIEGKVTDDVSIISNFLSSLEGLNVLKFKDVHLYQSSHYYKDIFLVRFFDTWEKDKRSAKKMLRLFDLEDFGKLAEYNENNYTVLLKLIIEFTNKIKRIYFGDEQVPFMAQLINAIEFDVTVDEIGLKTFLKKYTDDFMDDKLVNPYEDEINYDEHGEKYYSTRESYYPYYAQKIITLHTLAEWGKSSGFTKAFLFGGLTNEKNYRKFENILVAEKEGWIKITRQENEHFIFNINKEKFEKIYKENKADIDNIVKKIKENGTLIEFGLSDGKYKSSYYEKTKILKVDGIEVMINKTKKETDQTKLLRTVFIDPKKTWASDEIYEDWEENPEHYKNKNTIDTARRHINEKVMDQAGIKDEFLEGNNTFVKVNPHYL